MSNFDVATFIAESVPIRDKVYEAIRDSIISGQIRQGERLIETDYAEKYHVSRSPIREALRRLESDGLLEYRNRVGMFVKAFTYDEIIEVYTIRQELECLAMRNVLLRISRDDIAELWKVLERQQEAYQNRDFSVYSKFNHDFHDRLIAKSGMTRLISMLEGLDACVRIFGNISMSDDIRRQQGIREHEAIIRALEGRNLENLQREIRRHVEASMRECLRTDNKMTEVK
jgi:DNA-binding GntR family transcriptional regulator